MPKPLASSKLPLTDRQNLARLFGMWTKKPLNGYRFSVLKAAMTEYELKARLQDTTPPSSLQ